MSNLKDKTLALLIQLPPSVGIVEGMNGLTNIIPELDEIQILEHVLILCITRKNISYTLHDNDFFTNHPLLLD